MSITPVALSPTASHAMVVLRLPNHRPSSEVLTAALIGGLVCALLVTLAPPGGDAPAHLYRAFLVRKGMLLWDNLWYGGNYPLTSYSLLYYLPAALVGNLPLAIGGAVASAAVFAAIVRRQFGALGRWPARIFAPLATFPLLSGTYSYALGFACALLSLRALQAGRLWLVLAGAALALGFSPLAFVFLVLILAALFVARGRLDRRALAVACALAAVAGLQTAVLVLFPERGIYPFDRWELVGVVIVGTLGAALGRQSPRARPLAAFFLVWALASVVLFVVPTPVGDNLTRLGPLAFPLMLLVALLAGPRPRGLVAAALVAALLYSVMPILASARFWSDGRPDRQAFWQPVIGFLGRDRDPNYRVEVVPTAEHWEAYWLPRAGFALARGWYRQLDYARYPLLYRNTLAPAAYRAWLRSVGVRYVVLPGTRVGPMGEAREARLLRSGRSGLVVAARLRTATVYTLPRPTPILTGAARARLTELGHERVAGWVAAPGLYRLRVRYMPYWRVVRGDVCLERARDGMILLRARRGGRFLLAPGESPAALIGTIASRASSCRASRASAAAG